MTMKIKVPATTANLGSGFDCVGLALDLWNEIEIVYGERGLQVLGYGSETLSNPADNLMYTSFERLINESGQSIPDVKLISTNRVPLARGLGSSAAAVVGGLFAANVLIGEPLSSSELLDLATKIEGHPDNVAPAIYGGFTVGVKDQTKWIIDEVKVPNELNAVLFIPDFCIETHQSRSNLPSTYSRSDLIYNVGRVALLINAFSKNDLSLLNIATKDKIHQPYRSGSIPGFKVITRAAINGGAFGVYISGSGPTIVALTTGNEVTVRYEIAEAARLSQIDGESVIIPISKNGASVINHG